MRSRAVLGSNRQPKSIKPREQVPVSFNELLSVPWPHELVTSLTFCQFVSVLWKPADHFCQGELSSEAGNLDLIKSRDLATILSHKHPILAYYETNFARNV